MHNQMSALAISFDSHTSSRSETRQVLPQATDPHYGSRKQFYESSCPSLSFSNIVREAHSDKTQLIRSVSPLNIVLHFAKWFYQTK
jgi:hypothetical protein